MYPCRNKHTLYDYKNMWINYTTYQFLCKQLINFQSYLLLHSFLCFPLNSAIKGMIQKRYDPMSRHVKRVRSQLDAVLLCAVKEELLKTWDGNSVQVQLRSPVYPAMSFCLQRERKPAPFCTSDSISACLLVFLQATLCVNWSGIDPVAITTTQGGGVPWLENRSSEPITDQHAVEDAGWKRDHRLTDFICSIQKQVGADSGNKALQSNRLMSCCCCWTPLHLIHKILFTASSMICFLAQVKKKKL